MHDVAILGAGAAGLFAAIRAAERGRKVLLVERNKKPGVKILMSGGSRCNVTHDGPPDEVLARFTKKQARFLRPSIAALTPAQVIAWFEKAGVALKTEAPHGKVFPRSDRATDVLKALLEAARARGVTIATEARVTAVRPGAAGLRLSLEGRDEVTVPRVVVATGGQSYPKAGTSGDGYSIARALGHTVVTPRPALVPLVLATPLAACSGIALENARIGLAVANGKILGSRQGELLFTHRGLSGPSALDLSGDLTSRTSGVLRDVEPPFAFEVALDLLPDLSHEKLGDELAARERGRGARTASAVLHGLGLPRGLVTALLALAKVPEERILQELRREERAALVRALKDLRLPLDGTLGFDKAEVTAGGVALDEVDPQTLASRKVAGLHFIGEVLDLDGPIGGYNFQAAWSTGWAVGSVV
jgi:predicted Rossmann fold flavoprotein